MSNEKSTFSYTVSFAPGAAAKRLAQVLEEKGFKQVDLSRETGLTPARISHVLTGRVPIGQKLAEKLSRALDISPIWLLYGVKTEGRRVVVEEERPEPSVDEEEWRYERGHGLVLPVQARASADPNSRIEWAEVDPGESVWIPGDTIVVQVMGESMMPVIRPGQWILAIEADLSDGDLVAVELRDGRRLFKKWFAEGREAALLASIHSDSDEKPVLVRVKDVRRVLYVYGALYRRITHGTHRVSRVRT